MHTIVFEMHVAGDLSRTQDHTPAVCGNYSKRWLSVIHHLDTNIFKVELSRKIQVKENHPCRLASLIYVLFGFDQKQANKWNSDSLLHVGPFYCVHLLTFYLFLPVLDGLHSIPRPKPRLMGKLELFIFKFLLPVDSKCDIFSTQTTLKWDLCENSRSCLGHRSCFCNVKYLLSLSFNFQCRQAGLLQRMPKGPLCYRLGNWFRQNGNSHTANEVCISGFSIPLKQPWWIVANNKSGWKCW